MIKKSVISLIAYDAHLLPYSIESYYNYVDEIVLGLDENRITWSGNSFSFEEDKLWTELKRIDKDDKIQIVENNFHQSDIALENDNYERNFLKYQCSHDWIFSFDADEVLVNPKEFFVDFIPLFEPYYDKADLLMTWYLPYKMIDDTTLVIANNDGSFFRGDTQGFTTAKKYNYTYCRWTDCKKKIPSPLVLMHWSFCRPEHEVNQKLNNFGHSDKTSDDPFFATWKQINLKNYQSLRNFKTSGYGSNQWERLVPIESKNLMKLAYQEANNLVYV